ncbi:MAG: hypothetical protein R2744_10530 [Bacteroidales bacterium]
MPSDGTPITGQSPHDVFLYHFIKLFYMEIDVEYKFFSVGDL